MYQKSNYKIKILLSFFIVCSIYSSDEIGTLINQSNISSSEFFREYKDVQESKLEYIYDINGKTTISKNFLKNKRLFSKTIYKNFKKQDVFIFYTNCNNNDCY